MLARLQAEVSSTSVAVGIVSYRWAFSPYTADQILDDEFWPED